MTFGCGEYLVCPYLWSVGNPVKNTKILDYAASAEAGYTTATTPDQRRISAAAALANPANRVYEIWDHLDIVGIFTLEQISPEVDALYHFFFFDGRFRGRRALILRFLREAFTEFGFQRISMHVPAFRGKYLDWVRLKLGFRYEGEAHIASLPESEQKAIRAAIGQRPAVWLASIGSRKERSHFHNGEWADTYVVRLLKSDLPME